MRPKIACRWISMLAVAPVFLQGCSQFAPQAPAMPQVDGLINFQADVLKFNTMDRADFVRLGYSYSDERCNKFFIELQVARNKNSYDAAELSALASVVTPGMTLLHAGATAVGITGGFFGFGTATALNYGKIMLLTEYNVELQDLVHSAMIKYKDKINKDSILNSSLSLYDAYSIVGGYAWLCTLPGIDSLAHSALVTGTEKMSTGAPAAPAAAPPSPAAARAARSLPPRLGVAAPPAASSTSVTIPQVRVER